MTESTKVLGIYLERSGATLLIADATNVAADYSAAELKAGLEPWQIEFRDGRQLHWDPEDSESAANGLAELRAILRNSRDHIQSVGISCYGPFETLKKTAHSQYTYGRVRSDTANAPLNGLEIDALLRDGLGNDWFKKEGTVSVIQTDAGACALGEAYLRGINPDSTLAFLIVAEGIGLGIVKGREILNAALHPEVGLLPAFPFDGDPIAPDIVKNEPQSSISQLACNSSLKRRYRVIYPDRSGTFSQLSDMVNSHFERAFWRYRSFCVAQACIACTFVITPDEIVVGTQIDPLSNLDKQSRMFVREQLKFLEEQGQPVFYYGILRTKDFISKPSNVTAPNLPNGLSATGATGMCYAAASATLSQET